MKVTQSLKLDSKRTGHEIDQAIGQALEAMELGQNQPQLQVTLGTSRTLLSEADLSLDYSEITFQVEPSKGFTLSSHYLGMFLADFIETFLAFLKSGQEA